MSNHRIELGPQTGTVFHIDDVAVFGEAIHKGRGQLLVLQKRHPLTEPEVGRDQGRLFLVPLVHQGKEQTHLDRLYLDIAELIDKQRIIARKFLEELFFRMIGNGSVEFFHKIRERDKSAVEPLVDGMDQKGRGQTGFSNARRADKNDVSALSHVVKGVINVYDFFAIQFRLPVKGKGLHDQLLGDFRPEESCLAGIFLSDLIFLSNDIFQQSGVRIIPLPGHRQIMIPVCQQPAKADVFQLFSERFIHCPHPRPR